MGNKLETVKTQFYHTDQTLVLESGLKLCPLSIAYETYGTLNNNKNNAVFVAHALTGDQHAAGVSEDGCVGWWDEMIGPGKPLDTNQFFIICANILGSCYGTTGPSSINSKTGKEYALDFPVITVRDMVKLEKILIDYLEIDQLLSVVGGSLGGMQALEWAISYPERVKSSIAIAATSKMSSQNMAFNEIGRFAILSDPHFYNGNYYDKPKTAEKGLAIARMIGHITYLSEESMDKKFGRDLKTGKYMFNLKDIEFEVQSYLHHQGSKFVERFDADSYLYLTKAMDYFDVTKDLKELRVDTKFLIMAYDSDWLFSAAQSMAIVNALRKNRNKVSYTIIESKEGHDSFLLNYKTQGEVISSFLTGVRI